MEVNNVVGIVSSSPETLLDARTMDQPGGILIDPYDALDRFIISREAIGLAARTLVWYREQSACYLDWTTKRGLDWCSPESVDDFLAHERRRNLKDSTVQARYRALSALFNWLVRRRIVEADQNPMLLVERPRIRKRRRRYVSLENFATLYRSIQGDTWLDNRDREMLLLMQFSGLRVSEVINLAPEDVDVSARLVHVRDGKGGSDRDVPFSEDFTRVHARYVMSRPAYSGPNLFIAHDGYDGVRGALTSNGVRQMLRRRCRAAGVVYYNPHSFRHGFAMLFLNAGMTLSALSEVMGHASEQTTKLYAQWLKDGILRAYDESMRRVAMPSIP